MSNRERITGLKKQRGWTWNEDHLRVVRSIARTGPGCHEGCGVLLYVEDGKLVKVEGDPEVPFNQLNLRTAIHDAFNVAVEI